MWPALLILALFAFAGLCIFRAVKLMRMTPEEREADRAKYKARADKNAAQLREHFKGKPKENGPAFTVQMSVRTVEVDEPQSQSLQDWKDGLATLWSGRMDIEFTYEAFNSPKVRRNVELHDIMRSGDGRIYLHGLCKEKQALRHFNASNITTMIKVGSKRYYLDEFLHDVLGVPQ